MIIQAELVKAEAVKKLSGDVEAKLIFVTPDLRALENAIYIGKATFTLDINPSEGED